MIKEWMGSCPLKFPITLECFMSSEFKNLGNNASAYVMKQCVVQVASTLTKIRYFCIFLSCSIF